MACRNQFSFDLLDIELRKIQPRTIQTSTGSSTMSDELLKKGKITIGFYHTYWQYINKKIYICNYIIIKCRYITALA